MPIRAPQDLLTEELKDIYSAEKQLSRALPKLSKAVQTDSLREMLDRRRDEGQQIIESLDQIFEQIEQRPGRKRNAIAEGLIEETNSLLEEIDDPQLRDAAMIGAMQKLEHYCIAAWGTAAAFAKALDHPEAAQTLTDLIEQGRQMDDDLTRLAEDEINPAMMQGDDDSDDSDDEMDDDDQPARRAAPTRAGQTRGATRGAQPARGGRGRRPEAAN